MIFLFQRIKKAISISRSMIFLLQTRYHKSNFYFMKYNFRSTRYHRSNFYFVKYHFPFPKYHKSNFYFTKYDFLFQGTKKRFLFREVWFSFSKISKKLPRVKNFRVPIFRVLGPKIATFGPNQQIKKYYQR